jgi:hypothetical protein
MRGVRTVREDLAKRITALAIATNVASLYRHILTGAFLRGSQERNLSLTLRRTGRDESNISIADAHDLRRCCAIRTLRVEGELHPEPK